jgi:DNA helicase-2/ATP-dependent DNA helicase PcrA
MAMAASPVLQAAGASDLADRAARADVYASPGWRRLQARAQVRPMREPAESRGLTIDATASSVFVVGDRVFNQKFGYGRVTGIEGDKLDIAFEKAGEKKVVAKFVVRAGSDGDLPF